MRRARVRELHYITHFDNVPSILDRGILSHHRARAIGHTSVADEAVQELRAATAVPGGGRLHAYACLYFDARNAMLYRLLGTAPLAILVIDPQVLVLPGVVVSDRNAASGTALFRPVEPGIEALDEQAVYAEWWNDSRDAKQRRCAEVLVPERIQPTMIREARVPDDAAKERLEAVIAPRDIAINVDPYLFFRGPRP